MKRILILEPYFGGSHKHFLQGLTERLDGEFLFLTLPARKWKMRMQLSAAWFAQELAVLPLAQRRFDVVLASTFVDVAVFRALVSSLDGWNQDAKIHTYFHENQFVYPVQDRAPDNRQFAAINCTTAMASDSIAFNSDFNRRTFLSHCRKLLRNATDMPLLATLAEIEAKSEVIYPGIDFSTIDQTTVKRDEGPPIIVWNHRWEHDKNPEEFFAVLRMVKAAGHSFRLMILGESFRFQPPCFALAHEEFSREIIHFGYAESPQEYYELLKKGDIVISTAIHEFYGISVIEAVRAGCWPLLPDRLSYPELFPKQFIYSKGKLVKALVAALAAKKRLEPGDAKGLTEKFSWESLLPAYSSWLINMV